MEKDKNHVINLDENEGNVDEGEKVEEKQPTWWQRQSAWIKGLIIGGATLLTGAVIVTVYSLVGRNNDESENDEEEEEPKYLEDPYGEENETVENENEE